MSTRNEEDHDPIPLFGSLEVVEGQVLDHIRMYLAGRTSVDQFWARMEPLWVESASPTANQVADLFLQLTERKMLPADFVRRLDEMQHNMRTVS